MAFGLEDLVLSTPMKICANLILLLVFPLFSRKA